MDELNYDRQIDVALKFREAGNAKESIAILSQIIDQIPDNDVKALVVVGSLLREASVFEDALKCFEKAVTSDSLSPRASLGLFHTLWNMGRYDDGFDELDRFLSLSKSDEHSRLLKEMKESLIDGEKESTENR